MIHANNNVFLSKKLAAQLNSADSKKTMYFFNKPLLIMTLLFSCLFIRAFANTSNIKFESVEPNVPYSKVANLPHLPAEKIIQYGDSPEQKIYYWPGADANQALRKPIIIFIHGGCWLAQFDISHSLALTSALALNNYEVFSIEYRRTGNGGEWPVAYYDILSALEVIAKQPTSKPATLSKAILIGHSAGGHLASLVAQRTTTKLVNQQDLYPLFTQTYMIGLAPIMDMPAYSYGENSCQKAAPMFMKNQPADIFYDANPLTVDFMNVTASVMFSGGNDSIVPPEMTRHSNATNIRLDTAGHFDWIHPGSDAFNNLIHQLESMR